MNELQIVGAVALGATAGFVNTVVGSGSLLTYPFLLTLGLPPQAANVTNTVAMTPASMSATWGYRTRLRNLGSLPIGAAVIAVLGSLCGAALLLLLPPSAFNAVVPYVVATATILVVVDAVLPVPSRTTIRKREGPLKIALLPAAVYGGYFGAAQGVILMAILNAMSNMTLQEVNAVKNFMTFSANITASAVFVFVADVDYAKAAWLAFGAVFGATFASRYVQTVPDRLLRTAVVIIGCITSVHLFIS